MGLKRKMHITIQTHIHGCFECPEVKTSGDVKFCGQALSDAALAYDQNVNFVTETCPLAPDPA